MGLVGPADIKTLQRKVHDYRAQLQASVDRAAGTPAALPLTGEFSVAAWGDLAGECEAFEEESASEANPLAYLYAGSAYDRGRALIDRLDKWRDFMAGQKMPNVPPPIPVPQSDLGLTGTVGLGLALVAAIFLLRELR